MQATSLSKAEKIPNGDVAAPLPGGQDTSAAAIIKPAGARFSGGECGSRAYGRAAN
jgi:hypothetical protein